MLFSSLFSSSSPASTQQPPSSPSPSPPTNQPPTTTTTTPNASPARPPSSEFNPPLLPTLWTPKTNLKLLFGGLAFFTFSVWSTRRATARKLRACIPPFYTSSVYHKVPGNGGAEALEALNLATINVLSFTMMSTGGALYALDINGVEDMRRYVRKGMVEEGAVVTERDRELEKEVEGWVEKVLGEKFSKELEREKLKERGEGSASVSENMEGKGR